MKIKLLCSFWCIFLYISGFAQQILKPGFDSKEYEDMLHLDMIFKPKDSINYSKVPKGYHLEYISKEMGLKNMWELWKREDGLYVISIRGTINDKISWMENFYCGMVPATGAIQIEKDKKFNYSLSTYPNANVHIGWLIGFAYLSQDMQSVLEPILKQGNKSIIVTGHSQGGALSYYVTSWLQQLQAKKEIPSTIQIKTYSSAAPKPGNIYFSYDYNNRNKDWAFDIINSADWVPETPVSIQTLSDFNPNNPFTDVSGTIKKQKFPINLVMRHAYNQLKKKPQKAAKTYKKYLGEYPGKIVSKYLPEYKEPELLENSYYSTAGIPIILLATDDYYAKFPKVDPNKFIHHTSQAYSYLLHKYYPEK